MRPVSSERCRYRFKVPPKSCPLHPQGHQVDAALDFRDNALMKDGTHLKARLRLRHDMAARSLDGEYYFLTADSTFHSITDTVGAFIVSQIETNPGVSVEGIVAAVEEEFDTQGHDVTSDVLTFVEELVRKGILEKVR